MIKKGQIPINKIGLDINKMYKGSYLVYGCSDNNTEHDYSRDYLTFTALEDGDFSLTIGKYVYVSDISSISYSIDNGETWVNTNNIDGVAVTIITPTIQAGNSVLWKGIGSRTTGPSVNPQAYSNNISRFSSNCDFDVSGNIMSLLYGDNFLEASQLAKWAFTGLFSLNTNIINARNLILPDIVNEYCYIRMFVGCTSLVTPPMLPATTLANGCYHIMFLNCSSLKDAPLLPATTLAQSCYGNMFEGCSSLNYVKMLATDISAYNALVNWLYDVSATGTFVKNKDAIWDNDGVVPSGWTVITASE